MRDWRVACFGNHALKSSARKNEEITDLYRADLTASTGMKLPTLDPGVIPAAAQVIT